MIPLSKTMRMEDFADLAPELAIVDGTLSILQGGDKAQHPLRRWEYAMALRAFQTWNPDNVGKKIADHGCCTGMFGPMMVGLGHDVSAYEIWAWGNQQVYGTMQFEMLLNYKRAYSENAGQYRWINRPICQLLDEDRNMDAVYCISTLEHIVPYEEAWRDLCYCVGLNGMLFITSDSAEDEQDRYIANNVRGGRMFNKDVYERLIGWGREEGLELLGGESDYSWDESCRLVPTPNSGPSAYGFACLSMVRV